MHGLRRRTFQTLPDGTRVTCVQINDHGFNTLDWFIQSLENWDLPENLQPYAAKTLWDRHVKKNWDYVLVVPWYSVKMYWCNNDGMQAWRHRRTGYVVPDHCRQTGGCPELWNTDDVKGKRELLISNPVEITEYLVHHHKIKGPRRSALVATCCRSSLLLESMSVD